MKKAKFLAIPLALAMAFGFAACGETTGDNSGNGGSGNNTETPGGNGNGPQQTVETKYDVTVVNGTIKDTAGWNHNSYAEGASVTVQPITGSADFGAFNHWEEGGKSVSESSEYTFTVTADKTVTAVYDAVVPPTPPTPETKEMVSVTVIGGTITGQNYNHETYEKGTQVSVTATVGEGEVFVEWQSGGVKVENAGSVYSFSADATITLTAVVERNFSVWDGRYPEVSLERIDGGITGRILEGEAEPEGLTTDLTTKTWHITSAHGLAAWAKMVDSNTGNPGADSSYIYSELDWGVFQTIKGGFNTGTMKFDPAKRDEAFEAAYKPDGNWTLSLDVDVDLAEKPWNPIGDNNFGLNGLTFEGNGHTIKNLYAESASPWGADNPSAGFFGTLSATNITIKNVTFDSAFITGTQTSNNFCGVVIGYITGGTVENTDGKPESSFCKVYARPQDITLVNVHVTNSFVGGNALKKCGLMIGSIGFYNGGSSEAYMLTMEDCTIEDSVLAGASSLGGFAGYIQVQHDSNPYGGRFTAILNGCTTKNFICYNYGTSATAFGSLAYMDSVNWDNTSTRVQKPYQLEGADATNVHLSVDTTNTARIFSLNEFTEAIQATTDDDALKNTAIVLFRPVVFSDDDGYFEDWLNNGGVVYLLGNATLRVIGTDIPAEKLRYIDPTDVNESGFAAVKDGNGSTLGYWNDGVQN